MTARYRPGGLSRFMAWVDGLPWHGWWVFPALYGLLFLWSHGIAWAAGLAPFGTLHSLLAVGLFYPPYALAVLAYINHTSQRALGAFWPATGWPDGERESWRYQFITSPSGYGLAAIVVAIGVAVAAFLSAPAAVIGEGQDRLILFIAYFPIGALGYGLTMLVIFHTSRQLWLVARIHREATAIDLFDRVPLYAFSSLTVRTGLAYVLSGYYTLTANGAFQAGNLVGIAVLAAVFAFGIACFVLPLWGIHDRLVDEKESLLGDVELRISRLGAELYRRIDAGEFDATKPVTEGLAGAVSLRDRIARVPTWPWRPQLLSGFVSALLLPVAVYLLTRAVAAQLGP